MPLFEVANAKSVEAPALHHLADILSECEAFRELSESSSVSEARTKVTIGPMPDPLDGEEYTIAELENEFFFCTVAPADEEGHEAIRPETLVECPNEGGFIEVYVRRQVRQAELNETAGKQDVYLYFLDRMSALPHQIFEQAFDDKTMRITSVRRDFSPSFNSFASEVAQRQYIWASLIVEWGDLDLGGNS